MVAKGGIKIGSKREIQNITHTVRQNNVFFLHNYNHNCQLEKVTTMLLCNSSHYSFLFIFYLPFVGGGVFYFFIFFFLVIALGSLGRLI